MCGISRDTLPAGCLKMKHFLNLALSGKEGARGRSKSDVKKNEKDMMQNNEGETSNGAEKSE